MFDVLTQMAPRNRTGPLSHYFNSSDYQIEIGVDEAGKGPMFGRVYTGATILPKDDTFPHELMKDSKRFTSTSALNNACENVKQNAIAWSVTYEEPGSIDKINIREATFKAMHRAIKEVITQIMPTGILPQEDELMLLVDGNDFKPLNLFTESNGITIVPHVCIEGGDNKYTSIAASSILAKVARDAYILDMVEKYPLLDDYYSLRTNKGYGTRAHMDGIQKYGTSPWHRKSYGLCKSVISCPDFK